MKHMREKVQTKLNAMASILIDDIIIPEQQEQEGAETVMASYYDKFGNKFTFTLGLTVTPKQKEEGSETEEPVSVQDQVALILEKITALEKDVAELKTYHPQTETTVVEDGPNEPQDPNTETTNEGSDGDGSGN